MKKKEEEIRIIGIEARFGLYIIIVGYMGMRQPGHLFWFCNLHYLILNLFLIWYYFLAFALLG